MGKEYYGYYVLIALTIVMMVTMWVSGREHISDLFRFMYFICVDIMLAVFVWGLWFVDRGVRRGSSTN